MRTILFLTLGSTLLFQAGCGGGDKGRPADLPKLFSVNITITQEGKPLEGAIVTLSAKSPSTYGTSMGTTNASGVATMRTYGYDGTPAGEYAVLVDKKGVENQKESKDEYGGTVLTGGQSYRYTNAQYADKDKTPHSLTVTEKGASGSFEVGAPVRVLIGNID